MRWPTLLILALLLAALSSALLFTKNQTMPVETRALFIPLKLQVDIEAIHKIIMNKNKESVVLKKRAEGWRVENLWDAPVEEVKVEKLLKLMTFIEGEQRSRDESLFADYGIQSESAYHLKLANEKEENLLHLLIGTQQPDELSVFIRKDQEAAVYLSQMPLLRALDIYEDAGQAKLDKQYWARLELVPDEFNEELINDIKIQTITEGRTIEEIVHLKKENDRWETVFPKTVFETNQKHVTDLIHAVSEGRAVQVVNPKIDYGFRNEYWQLRIGGGQSYQFDIAFKDDKFYFREKSEKTIYEISSYQAKRLRRNAVYFIEENPFDINIKDIKDILMRYKESELFINAAEDSSNTLDKIVPIFENFALKVQRVDDVDLVKNFADNVPYEIVLRHSEGREGKAIGFGEKDEKSGRYPLQAQGSEFVYSIDEAMFNKIFLPFAMKSKTEEMTPELQAAASVEINQDGIVEVLPENKDSEDAVPLLPVRDNT